jgi:hypothetical protein
MRWIAEKTGHVVSQVEPNAVVRLEIDGAAAVDELVRVVEELEPAVRKLLRELGRHTRRPLTTLRWDTRASPPTGGLRTQAWHAVQLPPAESVTHLVAEVGRRKSPPLLVGGPVQVTFNETRGIDAKLGAPLVAGLDTSSSVERSRSRTISGTAYGTIDPRVQIRALAANDELIAAHFERKLVETSVRFRVSPPLLLDEWNRWHEGFSAARGLESETAHLTVEEGQRREFTLRIDRFPNQPVPLVLAVFDDDYHLSSVSDLGVVLPA